MIQLYPKGTTDFTRNGIELAPAESEVNWQIAGRYDFTMNIPREKVAGITLDYGQILKVSVPPEHVNAISLGTVSYYTVSASNGTPLYSRVPSAVKVSYNNWQALRSYMAGDKVTYDNKNWQCVTGHGGLSVPPPNGGLWTQISGSRMDAGSTITTLASGASLMKVRDFNATYIEAATTTGYQGFVKVADVTATGSSGTRTVPAFDITEQLFTINKIDKETDRHMIRIEAEHISYQLGRTVLGECNVVGVSPATALQFIAGAMQESYTGGLYCGIDDGTVEGDWSWKNAQSAILDPSSGLLKDIDGRIIRDDLDVYMIGNAAEDAAYEIAYGVNMKTVRWTGDVSAIVTRVYPIAQREDGTRMTLPEKYIDSVLTVPYIRPEVLDTKLKVGQKVENSDGTEVELTESEVLTRMRAQAQDRFDVDKCDQAEVTLELDYVHMPDTEEYKDYLSMTNLAPAQWVRVINGPMGVDTVIQLTEYTFDPVLKKYKTTKYGKKTQKATVAGYNIKSGAVTGRTIASGAVSGANIQAGAITAREIEANSITAEQIASKIITAQLIAASAITATEIAANAVTAEKINAQAVTTDKLAANAVTAGKIKAGEINADHIAAAAIAAINAKLGTATIENGYINNAYIEYARLKAATAESLIARDAVTDRYFIDKLQVRNVQAVEATVGELVIKASDNKYYRLDVGSDGSLTPTEVTLTAAEIAAGVTSNGHGSIIETDLTVQDLAASNIKGINALIDKLTASRIDVDELFARTAFIGKLNTTDISSNSYLQVMVNGKNKTYRQWTTPSDPHEGDTWYKQGPQPISEMQNYTMSQLGSYPMWAFDGYELYRYESNAWRKIDDPAEVRSTIAQILMTEETINIQVAQLDTEMDTKYTIRSGVAIELAGIEISGNKYVRIKSGGKFVVDSGNFSIDASGNVAINGSVTATSGQIGGFSIGATRLSAGSSSNYICIDGGTSNFDYFIMAGGATAANAKFLLGRDGNLVVESLTIRNEAGTANQQINLSNYALWKLQYQAIKSYTASSITLTNGAVVNFNTAAGVVLSGGWTDNWTKYTVEARDGNNQLIDSISSGAVAIWLGASTATQANVKAALEAASNHHATISAEADGETIQALTIDASGVYSQGYGAGQTAGYNSGYTQGHLDGVASVSVYSVEQQGAITYGSSGNYSVPVKATASNGATGAGTIVFAGTDAYKAGWNAYRASLVSTMGGKTNLCKTWTYRGNLYGAPQQGAAYYRDCYNGLTFADIPDAM